MVIQWIEPILIRPKSFSTLLILILLSFAGCEEIVHLRIVAPISLTGASIFVDRTRQGTLVGSGDLATLTVDLTPYHESVIVIDRPPDVRIIRRVLYRGYGMREIIISPADVRAAMAKRGH